MISVRTELDEGIGEVGQKGISTIDNEGQQTMSIKWHHTSSINAIHPGT